MARIDVESCIAAGHKAVRHADPALFSGLLEVGVALLWYATEQSAHLGRVVAAVATEGLDRRDLAGLGPAGDGLGVDAEQRGDLRRRQQSLGLARSGVHVVLPSMSAARAGGMRQCHVLHHRDRPTQNAALWTERRVATNFGPAPTGSARIALARSRWWMGSVVSGPGGAGFGSSGAAAAHLCEIAHHRRRTRVGRRSPSGTSRGYRCDDDSSTSGPHVIARCRPAST